jgi:hypothetical protein
MSGTTMSTTMSEPGTPTTTSGRTTRAEQIAAMGPHRHELHSMLAVHRMPITEVIEVLDMVTAVWPDPAFRPDNVVRTVSRLSLECRRRTL